jgi:hypothetical protein
MESLEHGNLTMATAPQPDLFARGPMPPVVEVAFRRLCDCGGSPADPPEARRALFPDRPTMRGAEMGHMIAALVGEGLATIERGRVKPAAEPDAWRGRRAPAPRAEDTEIPGRLDTPAFRAAWGEWLDWRRKVKRKPVHRRQAAIILADLATRGEAEAIDAIRFSIRREYLSITTKPKYNNGNTNGKQPAGGGSGGARRSAGEADAIAYRPPVL